MERMDGKKKRRREGHERVRVSEESEVDGVGLGFLGFLRCDDKRNALLGL